MPLRQQRVRQSAVRCSGSGGYGLVPPEGLQERRISHGIFDKKGDRHRKSPQGHWSHGQAVFQQDCLHGPFKWTGQLVPGRGGRSWANTVDTGEILKAAACNVTNGVKQLLWSHEWFHHCPWNPRTVFQGWFSCPKEAMLRMKVQGPLTSAWLWVARSYCFVWNCHRGLKLTS